MSANVIPTMRYADVPAAIEWLCSTFGFEKHMIAENDDGGIEHAQLTIRNGVGSGMIMLGPHRDDDFGKVQAPIVAGARATQSAYVVVEDCAALCARATAAGADIFAPLSNPEYGGQAFGCRDPQGQVWNFGTYDPWADPDSAS